ncbi:Exocyst complex, component Exoc1 [Ophiocordyceps camponoti-floridani]|uniref:Exocyst complex, component Exoc1 n=1 Tax=Ophiocordyceps camponoti-floridani TaxID=2030778 RepID=A0A8H4QE03_9HYPO|nr:Exocyst complex, component Exoc1 [Ophiocordyceps camponoti-floridani]
MDRVNGASAATSRAERFEDEKRRIIESCFNKREADGSLIETYITHIRITEYSQHPSTPPPPEARTPDSEKPRVIIVAVRRSGRVRMHKSKENTSGTFSIGKTWNLDDLSQIESFTGPQVGLSYREWAGDTGFVVTLGKPYFWQAQTDKEKKFFIASLIKIFGKYTGGKTPELTGFDAKELDQVLGAGRRPTAISARSPGVESVASSVASPSGLAPTSTSGTPEPSRFQKAPITRPLNGTGSPALSSDSISSRDRVVAARRRGQDAEAGSFGSRRDDGNNTPRSRNGIIGPAGASTRYVESRESPEQLHEAHSRPPSSHQEERPPPERRRPPMDPSRPQDRDLVPPPLVSPKPEPTRGASAASGSPVTEAISPIEVSPALDASHQDESRPGLGPMIKAKRSRGDIAGALWKAASAATAFRPRPGGAGDRLRQAQGKEVGPDGITSVVPAPSRPVSRDPRSETPDTPKAADRDSNALKVDDLPSRRASAQPSPNEEKKGEQKKQGQKKEDEVARSVVAGNDVKYLRSLGIDSSVLDGRSEEFAKWLDYFGWVPGQQMRTQTLEDIKPDIERELNRAQAGGWLARFEEEDERVAAIKRGIDQAIAECDEMDNLLTLYAVELSTLSEDISYIEAQGQGLQVQTANQKLLRRELESLLETCAITHNDLEALQMAQLDKTRGLEEIESALVTLFRAMVKMDPTLRGHEPTQATSGAKAGGDSDQVPGLNSDYGNMRIVQEKKQMYMEESHQFMQRLIDFMSKQFDDAFSQTERCLEGVTIKTGDASCYDAGRELLWRYSPLMLYARDLEMEQWETLLVVYQKKSHPLYVSQVQNMAAALRRDARRPTGDEADLLFSSQADKNQEGGVATTARKLTVKRSQTLAKALRSPLEGRATPTGAVDKTNREAGCLPYEMLSRALDEVLPLVEMEQNFIIDFFHATTLEQVDFPDAVAACSPHERQGGDLRRHRLMEPDRERARRVTRMMEEIFGFLEGELQRLMEWVVAQDPLQGVGVLAVLERKSQEMSQSNQEFVHNLLGKLHSLLEQRFQKFVDEQIRAIEEIKVKVKKRRGVISFIRIFPVFASAVENMMAGQGATMGLRRLVNAQYDRLLKAMFESLMVIAREHPAAGGANAGGDAEDKEALNSHILVIENMNHFIEETETRGLDVLEERKDQARDAYEEQMSLYINAVMRRPLGKLLDQLESTEAQQQMGKSAESITRQTSNSVATFTKVLGSYEPKEVRKGIEALRKRVEKHFGDADDPALSRGLVQQVTRECERFYGAVEGRVGRLLTEVYGGEVPFEWPRNEVKAAFR